MRGEIGYTDAAVDAFARVWDLRSTLRWAASERLRVRGDFSVLRERQRWPVGGGFSGSFYTTGNMSGNAAGEVVVEGWDGRAAERVVSALAEAAAAEPALQEVSG